jgi:hypothetical protein
MDWSYLGKLILATPSRPDYGSSYGSYRPQRTSHASEDRVGSLLGLAVAGNAVLPLVFLIVFLVIVRRALYLHGFLGAIPRSNAKTAIIHTLLLLSAPANFKRLQRLFAAVKRRAVARGYEDKDPRQGGPTLSKTQPLSLRRALIEADFLKSELRDLAADA